ncbi:uncharacterized protein Z519_11846 [Cladophialophora bantiana CBS 173.52]|uniref:Cell pattern formation-associated protein stuA n=1 Tax=Cladophialophora bantiana (strain ATCC 10958 / CBS 173.52 / CDC B-1940 / NIH 8579) TaxID=1442370 RepID=A0A0D2H2M5_CLAB1|nr:uncharacterized protein Z519_11846 [Cladophialophora bantiana CBS 173.52]KIW87523.1 hypothetical protein Z519_11846 [Cladophialophora bantiana CBS 173.52]
MRPLPTKRNPLVAPGAAPSYEELVSRRRLGKTKLTVKPGQVGTSNATKAENLGPFEYAHLRAPLPEDLTGSEIFASQSNQAHPETYFLMRRSKDGFVSATGMFKIAFPWAAHVEEKEERDYLKSLETTSQDEVAGNVWVAPEFALELAEEYGLSEWIRALLDPTDITQTPSSAKKPIAAPPRFELPADKAKAPASTKAPRSRATRSSSPAKVASPTKVKASPRKRQTKAQKEANIANANAASATLQSALDDAASVAETESKPESPALPSPPVTNPEPEMVKVEVDQSIEVDGATETTHTTVTVDMPVSVPELPLPEDTEKMLETARKMVEEAKALESSPKVSKKRKAQEPEPSDIDAELPAQPVKKARVLEEKLKREKVRTRAIFGVTATLAIAAAIPYFF